ncbi:hypothetical protein KUCAC02_000484, partial [Chaenocephalus aceratus]
VGAGSRPGPAVASNGVALGLGAGKDRWRWNDVEYASTLSACPLSAPPPHSASPSPRLLSTFSILPFQFSLCPRGVLA